MEKQIVNFARDPNGNLTFEPFKANGTVYKFIKPGDPIGIEKWAEYQKLQLIVGAGITFSDLIIGLRAHKELLSSDQKFSDIRSEAILWADSQIKGIIDLSQSRYDKAFYLATIFIYQEGVNPLEWSMEIAENMIADWVAEGINEQDLFFFAMLQIPAWKAILSELSEQAERQAARSLVDMLLQRIKR